jgi:hypothetical protein
MRFFRLAVLAGVILAFAGCRQGTGVTNIPNPLFDRVLPCETRNPMPPTVSQRIGSGGGVLVHPVGHRLEVPQGAVRETVDFSMTVLEGATLRVDIRANQQESFDFARGRPATLTLSYRNCPVPNNQETLRVYRINLQNNNELIWRFEGRADQQQQAVSAQLQSLTGYTIGTFSSPSPVSPRDPTRQ